MQADNSCSKSAFITVTVTERSFSFYSAFWKATIQIKAQLSCLA